MQDHEPQALDSCCVWETPGHRQTRPLPLSTTEASPKQSQAEAFLTSVFPSHPEAKTPYVLIFLEEGWSLRWNLSTFKAGLENPEFKASMGKCLNFKI